MDEVEVVTDIVVEVEVLEVEELVEVVVSKSKSVKVRLNTPT